VVGSGWHPSPSGEWVGILPTHPPDKTWHPPTIWVAGIRWVDSPGTDICGLSTVRPAKMETMNGPLANGTATMALDNHTCLGGWSEQ